MDDFILEMKNITKDFPGVRALNNVCLKVKKGEIHALCGENGAGKSTLMKILSGVYPCGTYEGEIFLNGKKAIFHSVKDAEKSGISIIHQELTLFKELPIYENIFVGNEPNTRGIINIHESVKRTTALLKELKMDVNPYTKVKNLGIGQQQLVEIAKALSKNTQLLILDEPTASLTELEVEILMSILKQLKLKDVTCIYISHKIDEVFRIADTITVIRDGCTIETRDAEKITKDEVIKLMVGREITDLFPKQDHAVEEEFFSVKNFDVFDVKNPARKVVDNASFNLKKGEILGIAGLIGAGRTELVSSIYGSYPGRWSGELFLNGKRIVIKNPRDALRYGIAMLPEDRKKLGLIEPLSVKDNITVASLEDYRERLDSINSMRENLDSLKIVKKLRIKTPHLKTLVKNLSGGNQQKVILARYLLRKLNILILDEPTRGIDVGAKYEIYRLINELIREGISVIMVSSELKEIIGMADRVIVMHEGKIKGEFINENLDQETIMQCAIGRRN